MNRDAGLMHTPPPRSPVPAWLRRVLVRGLASDPDRRHPDMPALLAALDHEVGIKRRGGWFAGAGVGLLALGLFVGLRSEAPAAEPPCRNAQALLRDAWSPERRAAIDRAFHASSLPYARSTWTSVQARLASYADRWASVYTDACEAHNVRRDQSGYILDRRMLCLDHGRLELDALTLVLARGRAAAS